MSVQIQDDIGSWNRSISPIKHQKPDHTLRTLDDTVAQRSTLNETASNFALRREKIPSPVFQGDLTEKPMKFLKEMRRYLQPDEASIDDVKYVLSRSLKEIWRAV